MGLKTDNFYDVNGMPTVHGDGSACTKRQKNVGCRLAKPFNLIHSIWLNDWLTPLWNDGCFEKKVQQIHHCG